MIQSGRAASWGLPRPHVLKPRRARRSRGPLMPRGRRAWYMPEMKTAGRQRVQPRRVFPGMRFDLRAPLLIDFRRLFASGQIPIGKIFGGYLQVATLKSSCIVLFVHLLKIHPFELIEIPLKDTIPAQLKRYCICKNKKRDS